jgi:hypothetical protein
MLLYCITSEALNIQHSGAVNETYVSIGLQIIPAIHITSHIVCARGCILKITDYKTLKTVTEPEAKALCVLSRVAFHNKKREPPEKGWAYVLL